MWEVLDWRLAEPVSLKSSPGAQRGASGELIALRAFFTFYALSRDDVGTAGE
jgi:hypothetical protein